MSVGTSALLAGEMFQSDRVSIRTADMRELPFADASFDVVVSTTRRIVSAHSPRVSFGRVDCRRRLSGAAPGDVYVLEATS